MKNANSRIQFQYQSNHLLRFFIHLHAKVSQGGKSGGESKEIEERKSTQKSPSEINIKACNTPEKK